MTLQADQKRYYLAGPMSGVPQFNVPLFDRVAAILRDRGFFIISPAELDSPLMRQRALASPDGDLAKLEKETSESWGDVLARDVKLVADGTDGIIFLPQWERSRGARLEAFVGLLTSKVFAMCEAGHPYCPVWQLHRNLIQEALRVYMP